MPALRYRNFAFTRFGAVPEEFPDTFDYDTIIQFHSASINFITWGEETCPKTGRKHHQGWLHCLEKTSIRDVARQLGKCHVEPMRGSILQNDQYCSKESALDFVGTRPRPGHRTDLEALAAEVKAGRSVTDIAMDNPQAFHQYGRTLQFLEDTVRCSGRSMRSYQTKGLWLYGPTGSGKSRVAFGAFTCSSHYVVNLEDKGWWDLYTGQSICIFDDFRGQTSYSQLLRLTDRYPMTVARRARPPAQFLSHLVIVTSALPPAEVYHNLAEKDSLEQLARRFTVVEFPCEGLEMQLVESMIKAALDSA